MKKITFLMLAVTLVLASTASAAGEVEFSNVETDYMMNIDFVDTGIYTYPYKKQYSHVYYVLLKKGYFSDFVDSFKDVHYDVNDPYQSEIAMALEEAGLQYVDRKVLPFIKYNTGNKDVYDVNCESIETKETGRGAFRCTDKKMYTDLDSRDELINFVINDLSTLEPQVSFRAADPAIAPPPYFSLREMLKRGRDDDKDGNGIPDSFEALPVSEKCVGDRDCDGVTDAVDKCLDVAGDLALAGCPPATAPEECVGDRDCDGVTDAVDKCLDVAGDLALAGCPPATAPEECVGDRDCDGVTDMGDRCPDVAGDLAQAGCPPTTSEAAKPSAGAPYPDVATGITRRFDEGGTCSLTSSASANPAGFLLITAALLALVRRLKKIS